MIKNYEVKAKLISHSQPSAEMLSEGIGDLQDLVAFCARVSNPSNQLNTDTTAKLLTYLAKHKHFSPFEMVHATIEVTTTRDIARQMLRHRSFSFQEYSQRYANPLLDLNFHLREARLQDTKNRQNSFSSYNPELQEEWDDMQRGVIEASMKAYEWAIDRGIAKEQARVVLPEGNTESKLYIAGTIRSFMHYVEVRSSNGTQNDHIQVALAIAEAISVIYKDINNYLPIDA